MIFSTLQLIKPFNHFHKDSKRPQHRALSFFGFLRKFLYDIHKLGSLPKSEILKHKKDLEIALEWTTTQISKQKNSLIAYGAGAGSS
jgi:hypothetical protein